MLHGCVYKHPADTQTQRVSEHSNHQWGTSLPYGWESWGWNVRCKFVFSMIWSRDAVQAWSTEECNCVLNSKEPNSRCVYTDMHMLGPLSLLGHQMLINHYHWISNPDLHLNLAYFTVEFGFTVKVNICGLFSRWMTNRKNLALWSDHPSVWILTCIEDPLGQNSSKLGHNVIMLVVNHLGIKLSELVHLRKRQFSQTDTLMYIL